MDDVFKIQNSLYMIKFGQNLRRRARELGFSDAEVARRSNIEVRRYGHYVTGLREPHLALLLKICAVLHISPNEALGWEADSASPQGRRPKDPFDRLKRRLMAAANHMSERELSIAVRQIEALKKR